MCTQTAYSIYQRIYIIILWRLPFGRNEIRRLLWATFLKKNMFLHISSAHDEENKIKNISNWHPHWQWYIDSATNSMLYCNIEIAQKL